MSDSSPHGSTGPCTIGLCPEPDCGREFYMPDPTPGDRCPHGHDGNPPELVIYAAECNADREPAEWGSGYAWTERLTAEMEKPAGVQPSAEAVKAADLTIRSTLAALKPRRLIAVETLAAAYAIDSPAIHAAGVVEGRAAMLREVVEWLTTGDRPYAFVADVVPQLVARFPSEGTT